MNDNEIPQADRDYEQGLGDGFMGAPKVSDPSVAYNMGYDDGENFYRVDLAAAQSEAYDYGYDSAVEQGFYDDDPSPYAGDYSEM